MLKVSIDGSDVIVIRARKINQLWAADAPSATVSEPIRNDALLSALALHLMAINDAADDHINQHKVGQKERRAKA